MLLPTHLFVTTVVATQLNLTGGDLVSAFVFGVLLDLDHVFYLKRFRDKDFWQSKGTKSSDHTWIHEPFGLLCVSVGSILLSSYIPLIFYSVHFFLDQFVAKSLKKPLAPVNNKTYLYGLIPSGSNVEWYLSPFFLLASVVIMVLWSNV